MNYCDDLQIRDASSKESKSSTERSREERPSTAKFFAESSIPALNETKLAQRNEVVQKAYVKYYENQMKKLKKKKPGRKIKSTAERKK